MPEFVEKSKSATRLFSASDHAPIFCMDQASFAPKLSIVWCLIPGSRTNETVAGTSPARTNDGKKTLPTMSPLKFISDQRVSHINAKIFDATAARTLARDKTETGN